MFKNKKRFLVTLFLIIATIFTACNLSNINSQGNKTPPAAVSNNYPVPQENRRGCDAMYSVCPSSTLDGYYRIDTTSKSVSYYDAQTKEYVTLCAQPGCSHNNETCQAWIGDVQSFTEYHGYILATRRYDNGNTEFIKKDISDGKIEIIDTWPSNSDGYYNAYINVVSDNIAVIELTQNVTPGLKKSFEIEQRKSILRYDITSGKSQIMFPEEQESNLFVRGISEKYALVTYRLPEDKQNLLTGNEFLEKYGNDKNYYGYIARFSKYELRLYDMDTYKYTVIASTEQDSFVASPSPADDIMYGYQAEYQCGDTIYMIDVSTGDTRELFTAEGIINHFVIDDKVFFFTADQRDLIDYSLEESKLSFYYTGIDEYAPVQLENGGNTQVLKFSPLYEGENFFISTVNEFLSKDDFYAERYKNARKI